ncbi:MAG: HTH domain-containing protein [Candidatus Methanofastidiosia archaeon]
MLEVFENKREFTSGELKRKTGLPDRTLRYALKILRENDFIRIKIDLKDTRRRIYVKNG